MFGNCANANVQDILEATSRKPFAAVANFATQQHRSRFKRRAECHPLRRMVSTAVTIAGGVNNSDHATTFPDLVKLLRSEVCHYPKQARKSTQALKSRLVFKGVFKGVPTAAHHRVAVPVGWLAAYQVSRLADNSSNTLWTLMTLP